MFSILVPIDFSENSNKAFTYACDFANDLNSEVTLLHCTENLDSNQEDLFSKLKKHAQSKQTLNIKYELMKGKPVESIQHFTEENRFNLIIMGTKGATDGNDSQMGSVTSEIIRTVKVNVLAIPEKAKYKPIKKIAYALDYVDFNKSKLLDLNRFAKKLSAEIILMHVSDDGNFFEEEKLNHYRKTMDSVVNYDNLSFEFLEGDDISKTIDEYIQNNQVDILAMLTRDYHLIKKAYDKSFTKKMLYHSKLPLLIFHQ